MSQLLPRAIRRPDVLVLSSDYGAPTPVWSGLGTCLGRDGLERLQLPPALTTELLAWQRHFDAHFGPGQTWDSPASAATYEEQGRRLQRALQEALPGCEVRLDLWCVTGEPPSEA